jgi:hypothetical protein
MNEQLTKKKWARRLTAVKTMENWIAANIKDRGLIHPILCDEEQRLGFV